MVTDFDDLFNRNKFDELLDLVEEKLKETPNSTELIYWKLMVLNRGKKLELIKEMQNEFLSNHKMDVYSAKTALLFGNSEMFCGNLFSATEFYKLTIKISVINSEPTIHGKAVNNLGIIALWRGEYQKAIELLELALILKKQENNGDNNLLYSSMHNISVVKYRMGRYREAGNEMNSILESYLKDELSNSTAIIQIIVDLVNVYVKLNERDKAKKYLQIMRRQINNKDLNPRFEYYYDHSRAVYLLSSPRLKDKSTAETILLKHKDTKKMALFSFLDTKMLLEYRLLEFSIHQCDEILEEIEKLFEYSLNITQNELLYGYLIDISLLQIKFEIILGNDKQVNQLFIDVIQTIQENNLNHLEKRVMAEKEYWELYSQPLWNNLEEHLDEINLLGEMKSLINIVRDIP